MGPAVKGAPYSAMEVNENTQTLGDGTHIDRKSQTTVSRDSQGRIRRETADRVTIWDPVAGLSYILDSKTQTAYKMMVNPYVGPGEKISWSDGNSGEVKLYVASGAVSSSCPRRARGQKPAARESDHRRSERHRHVGWRSTIEAGAIGNDRPIQIVSRKLVLARVADHGEEYSQRSAHGARDFRADQYWPHGT